MLVFMCETYELPIADDDLAGILQYIESDIDRQRLLTALEETPILAPIQIATSLCDTLLNACSAWEQENNGGEA